MARLVDCIREPERQVEVLATQEIVSEKWAELYGTDSVEYSSITRDMGATLSRLENYPAAIKCFEESLTVLEKHGRSTKKDIASVLLELAETKLVARQLPEAERLYQRAVEETKRFLGETHAEYWNAQCGLGYVTNELGRLPEAEAIQDTVIYAGRMRLQRNDPGFITFLFN
jgi:tetratricopeptide (TPR) repeat protein